MNDNWSRCHVTDGVSVDELRVHATARYRQSGQPSLIVHPDGTLERVPPEEPDAET